MTAQTPMEFSCPAPGTGFTFKNGSSIIFRGQEGFYCNMLNNRGVILNLGALLYAFTEERKRDSSWAKYIDPRR